MSSSILHSTGCFVMQAGQSIGWTGFTWDNHLFPDPKGFLDW